MVQTDHLEAATITNSGLDHTDEVQVTERFRLSDDGKQLLATQEFSDPSVIENHGIRFIAWTRQPGQHVYPYECDPGFAGNYSLPKQPAPAATSQPTHFKTTDLSAAMLQRSARRAVAQSFAVPCELG